MRRNLRWSASDAVDCLRYQRDINGRRLLNLQSRHHQNTSNMPLGLSEGHCVRCSACCRKYLRRCQFWMTSVFFATITNDVPGQASAAIYESVSGAMRTTSPYCSCKAATRCVASPWKMDNVYGRRLAARYQGPG